MQPDTPALVQAWTVRSPLQRLGSALAVEALLAAANHKAFRRTSDKILAADSEMTTPGALVVPPMTAHTHQVNNHSRGILARSADESLPYS